MQHALEADHIAAVASLGTRATSLREGIRLGSIWGLGHTLTLFVFGTVVLVMNSVVPERLALGLEFAVGVMLVFMGGAVLREIIKRKVHVHSHRHLNGGVHIHLHSHENDPIDHALNPHRHNHPPGFPLRSLFVGMMHGMAGSAALILLTLQQVDSLPLSLLYIFLFGLGSTLGMALLSIVIVIPLRFSKRSWSPVYEGGQLVIGLATFALGVVIMVQTGVKGGLLI